MSVWYALRTHSGKEEWAQRNIREQGYETLLPLARIYRPQAEPVMRPLFTRYLFVAVTPHQRWQPLASTSGVKAFVGYLQGMVCPPKVREADIEELKSRIQKAGGYLALSSGREIHPGIMARVLFGPLKEHSAIVTSIHGSRVEVLLRMLGADHKVKLPFGCLEAA